MVAVGDGCHAADPGIFVPPHVTPEGEHCIVVDHSGSDGILSSPDGTNYVVLPRPVPQLPRPEEDETDDPVSA